MLNEKCLEISRKAELLERKKIPFKLRYNSDLRFQCAFTALKIIWVWKIFKVLKFKAYHYHKKRLPRKGNITECFPKYFIFRAKKKM